MRVERLAEQKGERPYLLKYPPSEAPHFTIETNKSCNIRCRNCFSEHGTLVKSRADIAAEVRLALSLRKAGTVTLLGGEPTLHPDLPGIVADIKRLGLRVQILTNGVKLLEPDGDELLDRLAEAGVDRILVHMDEGQAHVHADLDRARRAVFDKLERRRMRFGLSLTITPETQGLLPAAARAFSGYRFFDSILAVLARDPERPESRDAVLEPEYESLRREFGILPSACLPAQIDDGDVRWLIYSVITNRRTGRAAGLSPRLFRTAALLYQAVFRRRLYVPFLNPRTAATAALLFLLARLRLGRHSRRIPAGFFRGAEFGRSLGLLHIVIQTPPEFRDGDGAYVLCHSCPDAVMRNGKLTPLCIADRISPLSRPRCSAIRSKPWSPSSARLRC